MNTTLDTDLEAFAAAVRRELHDLGPDVVDDLTDGLEADLADSLADGGQLGNPVEYAAELRSAAGLDPRSRRSRRPSDLDAAARAAIAEMRAEAAGFVSRHPRIRGVVEFFVSLRAVWWVLRAVVLLAVPNSPNRFSLEPDGSTGWLALAALTVLSVQWGRGRWLPCRRQVSARIRQARQGARDSGGSCGLLPLSGVMVECGQPSSPDRTAVASSMGGEARR